MNSYLTEISKEFSIEAAHRLPNVAKTHKCHRLHGHSFTIIVTLRGKIDPNTGWIADFQEIKDAFNPIFNQLDHHYLNDTTELENPTCEQLARWVYEYLECRVPFLVAVEIQETCTSSCRYEP